MTFKDWIESVNGKYIEMAGSANAQNQCVDCANSCIKNVFGQPMIEWTNAIDFPQKAGSEYDYIENSPSAVPQESDLIIFGLGSYGHISVFVEGDINSFRSMDQNYPLGTPCHIQNHSYKNVLGWLHFKSGIIPGMEESISQIVLDLIIANGLTEGDIRWLIDLKRLQTVSNLEEQLSHFKDLNQEYQVEKQELLAEITEYQKSESACQSELKTANKKIETLSNDLELMTEEKNSWQSRYNKKNEDYNALLNGTESLITKFLNWVKNLFIKEK